MPCTGDEATHYAKVGPRCARLISACRGCSGRTHCPRGVSGLRSRCRRPKIPTHLVHSLASTLDAARDADVVVLWAGASSEELEDVVRTVGGTLAETLGRSNGSGAGVTMLCLNRMDLVSEECARELRRQYPEAVMISALEGCDALLEEMLRSIASGRTRMEVLIPHAKYAAASRLYGLAEIHAQENTTGGCGWTSGCPALPRRGTLPTTHRSLVFVEALERPGDPRGRSPSACRESTSWALWR
jgi:hypothetical protein